METIIKSLNRKIITQAYEVGLYYSEYDLEGHFICQQMIPIKKNHTSEEAEKEFHAKLRKKFNIKK